MCSGDDCGWTPDREAFMTMVDALAARVSGREHPEENVNLQTEVISYAGYLRFILTDNETGERRRYRIEVDQLECHD